MCVSLVRCAPKRTAGPIQAAQVLPLPPGGASEVLKSSLMCALRTRPAYHKDARQFNQNATRPKFLPFFFFFLSLLCVLHVSSCSRYYLPYISCTSPVRPAAQDAVGDCVIRAFVTRTRRERKRGGTKSESKAKVEAANHLPRTRLLLPSSSCRLRVCGDRFRFAGAMPPGHTQGVRPQSSGVEWRRFFTSKERKRESAYLHEAR